MDLGAYIAQFETELETVRAQREALAEKETFLQDTIASLKRLLDLENGYAEPSGILPKPPKRSKPSNALETCGICRVEVRPTHIREHVLELLGKGEHVDAIAETLKITETRVMLIKSKSRFKGAQTKPETRGHTEFCEICQEDAGYDHLKEHALDMLRNGDVPKKIAAILKISAGRIQAWQHRAGIALRRSPIVPAVEAAGRGRPRVPIETLELASQEVEAGASITQAAKNNGIHQHSRSIPQQSAGSGTAPCGQCYYRVVDGRKYLAAQPDCPTHGTGLGVEQPGRERGPDVS